MQSETSFITPFAYTKIKLNYRILSKDKYDKNKQIRALMNSLDANSLCSLYLRFIKQYKDVQFFAIHDCFATTFDKVFTLKTLLV